MKIMFCLGTMTKGGAERVIANLSNDYVQRYDIDIVVTPPDKPMYKLDKRINYITLDNKKPSNNILIRTIKRILKLRKIIKEERPNIIVSLLPEPTFRLMIAKIFLKQKVIISVRNDPNVEYNNFFKRMLVKILFTKAQGFIFQTEDAKMWFSNKIQKKSIIIPNPINENFILKEFNGKRKKEIVTVGRLAEQKNQLLLIRAFSKIVSIYPDYILKIYGSGPLQNILTEYINNNNLSEKVYLMGEVDKIEKEIYKSEMFVLCSNYEGMPNALMEAMTLGLPCISTDCPCGGPKFLIKNNYNGILIDVNNEKELIEKILFLIEHKDIANKYGLNARKIIEDLSPIKIMREWENYIIKIINE